jgi:ankyrin repeat protein
MQDGATPLYIACARGHVEVVKLLLAHPDVAVNKAHKVRRSGCCRARWRCVGDKVRGGGDGR